MEIKRETKVTIIDHVDAMPDLVLSRGKKSKKGALTFLKPVEVDTKSVSGVYKLNVIEVSPLIHSLLPADANFVLVNPANGKFDLVEAVVSEDMTDAAQTGSIIRTVPAVRERLGYTKEQKTLYLCCLKCSRAFTTVRRQSLDHVKDDNLIMSAESYDVIIKNAPYKLFDVVNKETGVSICLQKKHIIRAEKAEGRDYLRMNRKHRIFLGLENREQGTEAKTEVYIRPVLDSFEGMGWVNPWTLFTRLFVGKSALSLMCRRPYECDENTDVVRLSNANMKLLGVEEMDSVILRHHTKSVKCRVLELDDKELFEEINGDVPAPSDLAVGIPAHVRKKLGLNFINCAVKIERDTNFLFSKSLPEQIVPLLLTFTTSGLVLDTHILWEILFAVVVVYVNLSSKRHMRCN